LPIPKYLHRHRRDFWITKYQISSGGGLFLIQILLKAAEHRSDFCRGTKVGDSVGKRVVIFQAKERRQLSLGKKQNNLSEMENGKRPIGKNMAKRLAEVLHTNYKVFL
jgi:hypothetical protein